MLNHLYFMKKTKSKHSKSTASKPLGLSDKWNENKKLTLTIATIVFAALITFAPVIFNDFTNWDDNLQVTENADITSLSFKNIGKIFSSYYADMYQPLVTLNFAFIYRFFGLDAMAFHAFSLVLHLVNIMLVFLLTKRLRTSIAVSIGVSLLFALNPLQVEPVAWVSATSTLLFTMFYLLSIIVYIDYSRNKSQTKVYFISLGLFTLSLLSKSAAVTLPVVLLAVDFFLNSKITRKDIIIKTPFLVLSVVFGMITVFKRGSLGGELQMTDYYTLFQSAVLLLYPLAHYAVSAIVPFNISPYHPYPEVNGGALPLLYYIIPASVLLLAIALIFIKKSRVSIMFGVLFFLFSISVMLAFIPLNSGVVKERYFYLPCIGIYFVLFSVLHDYTSRRKSTRTVSMVAVAGLAVFFAVSSFTGAKVWKNSSTLWTKVIEEYPKAHLAYYNRGTAFFDRQFYLESIDDYKKTIELKPDFAESYLNMGVAYKELGMFQESLATLSQAISIKKDPVCYFNRGSVYGAMNLFDEAINDFTMAIKLNPRYAEAFNFRGVSYGNKGLNQQATADFLRAISIDPDYADAYKNLGVSFLLQGMTPKACESFHKARELGSREATQLIVTYCENQ